MHTPINRFKLSTEGKKVFDMVERYAREIVNINSPTRHIRVSLRDYMLLLEGTPQIYHKYDSIPYGDFSIVGKK
jgi:hypothetical protein